MDYVFSDPHFFHDKEFIWGKRGFHNVHEMNEAIINNWNETLTDDDTMWMLGDFFVGIYDKHKIISTIERLKGKIHIIRGNHDTKNKIAIYAEAKNVVEIANIKIVNYRGYKFYLSHKYVEADSRPKKNFYCVHGHTHFPNKFTNGYPYDYNASCDATNMRPISMDEIISDIELIKIPVTNIPDGKVHAHG